MKLNRHILIVSTLLFSQGLAGFAADHESTDCERSLSPPRSSSESTPAEVQAAYRELMKEVGLNLLSSSEVVKMIEKGDPFQLPHVSTPETIDLQDSLNLVRSATLATKPFLNILNELRLGSESKKLATTEARKNVWDPEAYRLYQTPFSRIKHTAFSADGQWLLLLTSDDRTPKLNDTFGLFHLPTQEFKPITVPVTSRTSCMTWSPDGKSFYLGSEDHVVKKYRLDESTSSAHVVAEFNDPNPLKSRNSMPGSVRFLSVSPDGNWLGAIFAVDITSGLKKGWLFDLSDSGAEPVDLSSSHYTQALAFSPDSKKLVAVERHIQEHPSLLRLWTIDSKLESKVLPIKHESEGLPLRLSFTADNKTLIAETTFKGFIHYGIYEAQSEPKANPAKWFMQGLEHSWKITSSTAAILKTGKYVFITPDSQGTSTSGFQGIRVFDPLQGKRIIRSYSKPFTQDLIFISLTPDEKSVIAVYENGIVAIWKSEELFP